jgi:hypothetical protein
VFLSRKPELPADLHAAWWAFLDCAEVLEGGKRVLVATLPVGRVEPAPIALGSEALRQAIADVQGWMPTWRLDELADEWRACDVALTFTLDRLTVLDETAASTDELDDVLDLSRRIMDRLDAFADAELAFRRRWRCPDVRPTPNTDSRTDVA